MHPILLDRKKLSLYLFAWLIVGVLLATLVAAPEWYEAFLFAVPLSIVYGFVCLSAWYLCRVFPLHRASAIRLLLVYGIAASAISSLWMLAANGWAMFLGQLLEIASFNQTRAEESRLLFGVGAVLYLLTVAVHYLMIAFEESREAERRALELRVLAHEAELRALRAQVDPHFLFNSLHSISALTHDNPDAARNMCLLLAEFLRKSLEYGSQQHISLEEETALSLKYLEIERIRFGSRLDVNLELDGTARECLVPPLILQPLIENSITHGIAHLVQGGTITLKAARTGDRLSISVANPCDPDESRRYRTGVGLENVRKRLKTQYNTQARLDVTQRSGEFIVQLSIPAIEIVT